MNDGSGQQGHGDGDGLRADRRKDRDNEIDAVQADRGPKYLERS
jgi:hypothetical protein